MACEKAGYEVEVFLQLTFDKEAVQQILTIWPPLTSLFDKDTLLL